MTIDVFFPSNKTHAPGDGDKPLTIDLISSSTRRDDMLLDENTIQRMWIMRKYLADMNPVEAMEFINDRFTKTQNNEEFLISMNS